MYFFDNIKIQFKFRFTESKRLTSSKLLQVKLENREEHHLPSLPRKETPEDFKPSSLLNKETIEDYQLTRLNPHQIPQIIPAEDVIQSDNVQTWDGFPGGISHIR